MSTAAEMGVHLCYVDQERRHVVKPTDLAAWVDVANVIVASVDHTFDWIHVPVAPVDGVALPPGADLYLGIVDYREGVDRRRRRGATPPRRVERIGIATACAMGAG